MIEIKVSTISARSVAASLAGMNKKVSRAAAGALNDLAFEANAEIKREMMAKIKGGPTRFTLAAFRVKKATPDHLTSVVALRNDTPGKGQTYDKVLRHLFVGGDRAWKRMEGAFRRIGVLPPGQIMVAPTDSWANPLDAHGNPSRGLIVRLISYFGAFGEQGYKANMTPERRARLAKIGRNDSGYKTIGGVAYFISRGPGMWYGRQQHLAAGIWAKRGTHGVDIAPVFLFVRRGAYRRMFDLERIGRDVVARKWKLQFDRWLKFYAS